MINTDKYQITNRRIICEALPFYARGRNIVRFLEAAASPLISVHEAFHEWALMRLIEACVTSQPMSLIWYLNYVFRSWFLNREDSFMIITDNLEKVPTIWYRREQIYHEAFSKYLTENNSDVSDNRMAIRNLEELDPNMADIIIMAPQQMGIHTDDDYTNAVRCHVDKYIVCSVNYDVIINYND